MNTKEVKKKGERRKEKEKRKKKEERRKKLRSEKKGGKTERRQLFGWSPTPIGDRFRRNAERLRGGI